MYVYLYFGIWARDNFLIFGALSSSFFKPLHIYLFYLFWSYIFQPVWWYEEILPPKHQYLTSFLPHFFIVCRFHCLIFRNFPCWLMNFITPLHLTRPHPTPPPPPRHTKTCETYLVSILLIDDGRSQGISSYLLMMGGFRASVATYWWWEEPGHQ